MKLRSEAEHTSASPWCPHPERWHAADDQATEIEVADLVGSFVRALQPELVVETGTYLAHTARAIGVALRRNGHGTLVTIEQEPALAALAVESLRHLPVNVICGDSLAVLPTALKGALVQFVWLDSGPQTRMREATLLLPYLDGGAVVGMHDTRPGRPITLDPHLFDVVTLRTPRGVSFGQLKEPS